ncbi:MAG: aminomethyl-transferring glycine dehydrogenase subunit GcvPA [Clostridia bacterium]
MGSYIPTSPEETAQMLARVGVNSLDALYDAVPAGMMLDKLNLPDGLSEMEVAGRVRAMAQKNVLYPAIFRGAGAYNHYVPAIVRAVTSKEAFVTAYTPYQAEISQGLLQSIFEFQTMICELTQMDAANASVYDGASAAAEAVNMCVDRKRPVVLIAQNVKPMTLQTVKTYCAGMNTQLQVIASDGGHVDTDALLSALDGRTACLYLESPNYFGLFEEVGEIADMLHAAGAKLVLGVNPIAQAHYKSAGELGADVCVGEGQPLGMALGFGGPYLGFMAASKAMLRKLPGRIVGETVDAQGGRAFVLTLQAREQHIRREKASSNICSNQALCAMTASAYMAAMGPEGMAEVARQCHAKASYLAEGLSKIPGFKRLHDGAFFHEFVTASPICPSALNEALKKKGILGGLPVEGGILWCATECNTKAQIDRAIDAVKEAVAQ